MTQITVNVVGAGAFGGWTALNLLQMGARVRLVEAQRPGHSASSSGGENRVIRCLYQEPWNVEMAARALELWQAFERQRGCRLLHQPGVLFLASGEGWLEMAPRALSASHVPHEILTVDEVARRWPQFAVREGISALWEPHGGYLEARRACSEVASAFSAAGGKVVQGCARPVLAANGRCTGVSLDDGSELPADATVFACGPWLPKLFPDLCEGWHVTRQPVFFFATPPGSDRFQDARLPVWGDLGAAFWYGIPGHGARGFKLACDERGAEMDPDQADRMITAEELAAARDYLGRRFPDLANARLLESRVCQYTDTPDRQFVVDRHPEHAGLWLAGGGSGHGFKHGPALGEYLAQRILGQREAVAAYSAARF